jgi:hypothetical protein
MEKSIMKTEDLAKDILRAYPENDPSHQTFRFKDVRSILHKNDDYARRAIDYLLKKGRIVSIPFEKRKAYNIKSRDRREIYYTYSKNDSSMKAWDIIVSRIREKPDGSAGREISENINLLKRIVEELYYYREHLSRFRNKGDIEMLLDIFERVKDREETKEEKYTFEYRTLEFIEKCLESGTTVIDENGKKEIGRRVMEICEEYISRMEESSSTPNAPSPMGIACLSFQIYVLLDGEDVLTWIGKHLKKYLESLEDKDLTPEVHRLKTNNITIFDNFLDYYSSERPETFKLENKDTLSLDIFSKILDPETEGEIRHTLRSMRDTLA